MMSETSVPQESWQWDGSFSADAYAAARTVLQTDRERATGEMKQTTRKRGRAIGIVAVVWAVCSVVFAFIYSDLLLVAEIGWAVIVIWAVFYLYPTLTGQGNLEEVFDQYAQQLDKLEAAEVPLPTPADMGDLVAALDLVSLPEGEGLADSAE